MDSSHVTASTAPAQTITVLPWHDPVVDVIGHDPRSVYVETFWLPSLGPTSVLLLRRLADRFDTAPAGIELAVADTSRQLGLGEREGASSPLLRTLRRLVQFGLATFPDHDAANHKDAEHASSADAIPHDLTASVRRMVPPIAHRHVRRLPATLAREHERFVTASLEQSPATRARARARRLAFVLLETGDESSTIERSLLSIGFSPVVAVEAVRWAISRHVAAQAALADEAA